jgi:hypothetical protein
MAALRQIQCVQVAFTSTSGAIPVTLNGVKRVILQTSADCYIDFDQPVAATQSYKLLAANTSDLVIELNDGVIQKMYVQGASGNGTLYIIVIEG